ncbi:hypothetical protein L1887_38079 [Cichorium endivia]|nr:hypothetical protein L1887_38079 [Cichorium endivia]
MRHHHIKPVKRSCKDNISCFGCYHPFALPYIDFSAYHLLRIDFAASRILQCDFIPVYDGALGTRDSTKPPFLQALALRYESELATIGTVIFQDNEVKTESTSNREQRKKLSVVGTPDYLALEILLNMGHGATTDWSVSLLLFELPLGSPPSLHSK